MLRPNTEKNLQRNRFPGDYKDSKREMQWEQAGELHDVPAAFDFMAFFDRLEQKSKLRQV